MYIYIYIYISIITCQSNYRVLLFPDNNAIFNNKFSFSLNFVFRKDTGVTFRIVKQSISYAPYRSSFDWHQMSF